MTTTAAPPPRLAQPAPPWRFPYATIFCLLAATLVIGSVALVSVPAAAILYIPFFLVFCWYRPYAALALMWGEVAFPFNVNGMSSLANTAPAEISLCLAFPVFWMRSIIEHRRGVFNPVAPVVWIYYIICILSTLVHWTGRDAIISIGQMALYLTVAPKFFSSYISNRRQMFAAMYGLIAATTFVAITLLIVREDDVYGVHKNATGTFLSYTVLILSELWLLAATSGRRKWWINILLLINFAGIIMSTSRGAWIGCIAGLTILLLARRQWGLFFRAFLIILPALLVCWYYVPESQRDYALNFKEDARNIKSRVDNAQFFYDHFIQSPVIGVGVGLRKERDSTNIIMSTLAETGILGLLAFLAIHVVFFWVVFRAMRGVPRGDPDFTILVLGAALVLCLFGHGMVDHYWSRTQLPVWGMGGAAIGVAYTRRYGGGPARRL